MIARTAALLATVALSMAAGCAASRASVTADAGRLSGPVSLSSSVPGPRAEILGRDDLEVVGRFTRQRTFRAIAWGLLLPWRGWDATDLFNEEMRRYGGEAIVGLTVSTETMSGGEALLSVLAAVVPIIPTSITVRISGTVVRRKPRSPGRAQQ